MHICLDCWSRLPLSYCTRLTIDLTSLIHNTGRTMVGTLCMGTYNAPILVSIYIFLLASSL